VTQRPKVWTLHCASKDYGRLPSAVMHLDDEPLLAACFDQAVNWFGRWVEAKLDEREPVKERGQVVGHRPRWRLGQLLGTEKPRKATREELIAMLGG